MSKFTVNLTRRIVLPDLEYINDLASEKGFVFGKGFGNIPKILEDLYYLFRKEHANPFIFDVEDYLLTSEYIEKEVIYEAMNESQRAYYNYTLLFLKNQVKYDAMIGITALDKALNVLMFMVYLAHKSRNQDNPMPNKQEQTVIENEKELSDMIEDVSNGISSMNMKGDSVNDGIKTEMTKCVRDHLYDLSPEIANVYGAKKPADMPMNKSILNTIKVKAYLENTKGLGTALSDDKVRDNSSSERENHQMESYAQVVKISKTQLGMENFDDKFIKKDFQVKEKVLPKPKKQVLYMLLDDSGSMNNVTKQTYVRAVLLNRLESVIKGKSVLHFCLYESRRYEFHKVETVEQAQKLYKLVCLRRPNGGGTNIGAVIQDTIDQIANLEDHHDPEIMIVCDGDDYVDSNLIDFKDVRVNALLLGTKNKDIETLTKKSKGFCGVEEFYNRY